MRVLSTRTIIAWTTYQNNPYNDSVVQKTRVLAHAHTDVSTVDDTFSRTLHSQIGRVVRKLNTCISHLATHTQK